jgi:hypothetical protein
MRQQHKGDNEKADLLRRAGFLRILLAAVAMAGGIITTYHATIYGIKAEIAAKADYQIVEQIDARLIRIETILTETMVTRAELLEMRDQLNRQLAAIEAKLALAP